MLTATNRRSCPVVTSRLVGYLSSLSAVESGIGVETCPWAIQMEPGRRVNITRYNFIDPSTRGGGGRGRQPAGGDCDEWTTVIREGNTTVEMSACQPAAGDDATAREKIVYTSRGGSTMVLIYLTSAITQFKSTPLLFRFDGIR